MRYACQIILYLIQMFVSMSTQIKWRGWAREDGTDTTWERGPLRGAEGYEEAMEAWDRAQTEQAQAELRRSQLENSCGIDIEAVTWLTEGVLLPLSDVAMAERAQAYQEKLAAVDQQELADMITKMNQIMGALPPNQDHDRQSSPMPIYSPSPSPSTSPIPPIIPARRRRNMDITESPPESPTSIPGSIDGEGVLEADDEAGIEEEVASSSSTSESPQPPVRRKQPPRNVRHHPK